MLACIVSVLQKAKSNLTLCVVSFNIAVHLSIIKFKGKYMIICVPSLF